MMKKLFGTLLCILILCSSAFAEDIYISQIAQGTDSGTNCANSHSASWFNTAGNWGGDAGKIDPGDTVYLCDDGGNFTTRLTTQATGTSGNRIIITKGSGESPVLNNGFTVDGGHSYITIDSLTITMASYGSCGSENGFGIFIRGGDYISITNNSISHVGDVGIQFYNYGGSPSSYATISGNTIDDCSVGIYFGGGASETYETCARGFTVENNEIKHITNAHCSSADAIFYRGRDHVFKGNYIHDLGTITGTPHVDAFQCLNDDSGYDCWDVTFDGNFIWIEGAWDEPNGSITKGWETGGGVNGMTARNNIIHAVNGIHSGGDKSTNFTIVNNTFIGYDDSNAKWEMGLTLDLATGGTNIVRNNIFVNWLYRAVNYGDPKPTSGYNLTYNTNGSNPICSNSNADCQQTGDQYKANPQFNNFAGKDFTLSSGSPAIDNGLDLGTSNGLDPSTSFPESVKFLNQDSNGTGWEIGAYVYNDGSGGGGFPDTDPPTVPTSLTASNITQNSALLSWNASTDDRGIAGYHIFRDGQLHDTTTTTSYSDTNLIPSTQYTYQVSAYDDAGNESSKSASLAITTDSLSYFSPGEYIEAESGDISSPMQIGSDSNASGEKYIYTNVENSGLLSFVFDITEAGTYTLKAKVSAADTGSNSFYVGVDNDPANGNDEYAYDTVVSTSFVWDNLSLRGTNGDPNNSEFDPMTWNLTPGLHTFTFYGREANTRLDQIILDLTSNTPPAPPANFYIHSIK